MPNTGTEDGGEGRRKFGLPVSATYCLQTGPRGPFSASGIGEILSPAASGHKGHLGRPQLLAAGGSSRIRPPPRLRNVGSRIPSPETAPNPGSRCPHPVCADFGGQPGSVTSHTSARSRNKTPNSQRAGHRAAFKAEQRRR